MNLIINQNVIKLYTELSEFFKISKRWKITLKMEIFLNSGEFLFVQANFDE